MDVQQYEGEETDIRPQHDDALLRQVGEDGLGLSGQRQPWRNGRGPTLLVLLEPLTGGFGDHPDDRRFVIDERHGVATRGTRHRSERLGLWLKGVPTLK